MVTLSLIVAAGALGLQTPTEHGVIVECGSAKVELAVASASAFRVSVSFDGAPAQLPTTMVARQTSFADFAPASDGAFAGIKTAFGSVLASASGGFKLLDAAGAVLASSAAFVLTDGGKLPPAPAPATSTATLSSSPNATLFGAGGGGDAVRTLGFESSAPYVANKEFYVPHYHSSDGYSALAVSSICDDQTGHAGHYPAAWALSGDRQTVGWSIGSERFDLYLLPGASLKAGTSAYYNLTGAPKVLPRYAYGFMACRWGWDRSDRQGESAPDYIERMLTDFRTGAFPIDAWISDFEWYTDEPDYNLPQAGTETFTDFWFNNITFPEPVALVEKYRAAPLHLRFGGIRKPRLGNTNSLIMARALDWTLPGQGGGGAAGGSRNLNYTRADVQAWYAAQQLPLLDAGVEFWWNDEGEATYFTFFHWNAAEIATLRGFAPGKRFLSINRAFTPGMSRQGAVTWTGDVEASWDDLQRTPGYVLNWGLAGSAHVTCDIGGFSGETTALLLTRWMQAGVFIPVMRVHSTRSAVPHFPFLWGDDAAAAMRLALNLRYQLVPYHYSNAHAAYASGVPMMRPMAFDFEHDAYAASLTSQWMDGDAVLVAPVLREDNSTVVYFPQLPRGGGALHPERRGVWFDWCNSSFHQGPLNLTITGAALDEVPRFVRSGSIVPLAPVVQYTDALPGGPLQLHIFSGADAEFVLVEDDGETDAYERGAVRRTTFSYDNEGGNLYTHVAGDFAGDAHTFTHFTTFLYTPDGHWPEDDDGPSSSAAASEEVAAAALHPMGKLLRIRLHPPRR